jgi:hypothetical protein
VQSSGHPRPVIPPKVSDSTLSFVKIAPLNLQKQQMLATWHLLTVWQLETTDLSLRCERALPVEYKVGEGLLYLRISQYFATILTKKPCLWSPSQIKDHLQSRLHIRK